MKRLHEETRRLEPWERYRALNDAMDEYYEMLDMANREARFALIIVGALNARAVRDRDALQPASRPFPRPARPWLGFGLIVYGGVAVHFFLQAIEVLRPRKYYSRLPESAVSADRSPAGVRYYEDVLHRDAEGHYRAWQDGRDLPAQRGARHPGTQPLPEGPRQTRGAAAALQRAAPDDVAGGGDC